MKLNKRNGRVSIKLILKKVKDYNLVFSVAIILEEKAIHQDVCVKVTSFEVHS